jgi:hypothetical protein
MHPNGEATLALQMDINSLSGQNVNGIPILSNRTIEQSVRLQENQTSVLSGLMESSEIRSLSGLPWLANAGPLGYLAGTRNTQQADTELLIAITPRQMRLPLRIDQTIYAGRGAGTNAPPAPAPAPVGVGAPPIPGAPAPVVTPGGQPLAPAPGIPAPLPVAPPEPGQPGQPPAPAPTPQAPEDQAPGIPAQPPPA